VVGGADALAEREAAGDRPRQVALGRLDGGDHVKAVGQVGRDRRGQGAAGAVGVGGGQAGGAQLDRLVAVIEQIDGVAAGQVAALDQHPARPQLMHRPGRGQHVALVADLDAAQQPDLAQVGGDDGGQWGQPLPQGLDGVGAQQRVAVLGRRHRVDDQVGQGEALAGAGHGLDDGGRGQHAGLGRVDPDVGGHRLDLLEHGLGLELVEPLHADGVLHRHGGDGRHAVDPVGQERLEVRLDPGPAAGVGPGDGEHPSRYGHGGHLLTGQAIGSGYQRRGRRLPAWTAAARSG
jgi:hypothetical protein